MLQEVRLQLPDLAWARLRRTMRYLTTDNTLQHHGQHSLTVTHLKSILDQTVRAASVWPRRPSPRSVNVVVARWLQLAPPRPAVSAAMCRTGAAVCLSAVGSDDTGHQSVREWPGERQHSTRPQHQQSASDTKTVHLECGKTVQHHSTCVIVCCHTMPGDDQCAQPQVPGWDMGRRKQIVPKKSDNLEDQDPSKPAQNDEGLILSYFPFYLFPYRICHMKNSFLFVLGWKLGTMSKFWLCWIGKVWKYLDQLSSRLTDLTFKTSISSALADITFDGWAFSSVWTSFILVPARQAAVSRVNKIKFRFAVFSLI